MKVTAKNAFGAELTHDWTVIMRLDGQSWVLLACAIGDEQVYRSEELNRPAEQTASPDPKELQRARNRARGIPSERRTWTDTSGQHAIEASFAGAIGGKVKLKKADGEIVTLSIDRLSSDDQEWIRSRGKR